MSGHSGDSEGGGTINKMVADTRTVQSHNQGSYTIQGFTKFRLEHNCSGVIYSECFGSLFAISQLFQEQLRLPWGLEVLLWIYRRTSGDWLFPGVLSPHQIWSLPEYLSVLVLGAVNGHLPGTEAHNYNQSEFDP